RSTARQAYENNPRLPLVEIGRAIGRSRRTVDNYIADLRAAIQVEIDLKIFRLRRLGIPIDRIALRLNVPQQTISNHSPILATLPKWVNTDLNKGSSVPKVAEKHGWIEPLVWAIAIEGEDDVQRFKSLNWGLRTWDLWNWNTCLPRQTSFASVYLGRQPFR
ncbi:MAG: HTH domain-containing protein, partial [Desulfobacterales bacterium]